MQGVRGCCIGALEWLPLPATNRVPDALDAGLFSGLTLSSNPSQIKPVRVLPVFGSVTLASRPQ